MLVVRNVDICLSDKSIAACKLLNLLREDLHNNCVTMSYIGGAASLQRGMVIARDWAELILSGKKTVECKSCTNKYIKGTTIGICVSGTNKVWGEAYVSDIKLLTRRQAASQKWKKQHN